MNIQLNYQGQLIDVPIQDGDAKCQYLYDYAQNSFQCQVQLFYTLPDGSTGEVDPSWPIIAIVQAGGQFSLNPIQQGENIVINIFVQDQPIAQLNFTQQQTLKEVLDIVNQNMQTQYQELELYDQQGNKLSNTLTDIFGQFKQAQQPFFLFIPKCQSGIQVDPSLVNALKQQQFLIEVYYQNQKSAELAVGPEQIMEEILHFVNQNTGQQDIEFEIYDVRGNFLSNNQQDTFGQYVQNQQPLYFYVPKRGQQNDKQSPNLQNNQSQEIQLQIIIHNNQQKQILVKPKQKLLDIVNDISYQTGIKVTQFELCSQSGKKLSQNGEDEFGNYNLEQQPLILLLNQTQQINVLVSINGQQIVDKQVSSDLSIQAILNEIGEKNNQKYTEFIMTNNDNIQLNVKTPQDLFGQFASQSQPLKLNIIFNQNIQLVNEFQNMNVNQIGKQPIIEIPKKPSQQQQANPQIQPIHQSPFQQNTSDSLYSMNQDQINKQIPVTQQFSNQSISPFIQNQNLPDSESQKPPQQIVQYDPFVTNQIQTGAPQSPLQIDNFLPPKACQQIPQSPIVNQSQTLQPQPIQKANNQEPNIPSQNVQNSNHFQQKNPVGSNFNQQIEQNLSNVQPTNSAFGKQGSGIQKQPDSTVQNQLNPIQSGLYQPPSPFSNPGSQIARIPAQTMQNPNNFGQQNQIAQPNQFGQINQFAQPNQFGQIKQFGQKNQFGQPNPATKKQNSAISTNNTLEQRIKKLQDCFKVQNNFSLMIDSNGEFVLYKFHFPIMVQGSLCKKNSKQRQNSKKYDWVKCNNISFAETDNFGFAIQWDNKNISEVKISIQ